MMELVSPRVSCRLSSISVWVKLDSTVEIQNALLR